MSSPLHRKKGKFITFEGGEGSGKSTQIQRVAARLSALGIDYIMTREPGGAPGAEEVRKLLVEGSVERWQPMSEALLHNAARFEHLSITIQPALKAGKIVVCDRFFDSTIAYQGYGHGLDAAAIANLHWLLYKDFKPDLTLILDLSLEEGLKRASARSGSENRYECMGEEFHERLRYGYLEIAAAEPERCKVINARGNEEVVHTRVMAALKEYLNLP